MLEVIFLEEDKEQGYRVELIVDEGYTFEAVEISCMYCDEGIRLDLDMLDCDVSIDVENRCIDLRYRDNVNFCKERECSRETIIELDFIISIPMVVTDDRPLRIVS